MARQYRPKPKPTPPMIARNGGQLMDFLLANMHGKNRNNIKTLLNQRKVLVNGMVVGFYNYQLQPGDEVIIQNFKADADMRLSGLTIVYEDNHIIVIDKLSGMSCSSKNGSSATVCSVLNRYVKKDQPLNSVFPINSLDRGTSGLMVLAKSKDVKEKLQQMYCNGDVRYTYLAVVEGTIDNDISVIESYIYEDKKNHKMVSVQESGEGEHVITNIETLKSNTDFSMLKVEPITNVKNQIRIHLKSVGHPIVGDLKYNSHQNPIERLGLHAWILTFKHPMTRKNLRFESHTPKRFLHLFDNTNL